MSYLKWCMNLCILFLLQDTSLYDKNYINYYDKEKLWNQMKFRKIQGLNKKISTIIKVKYK